MWGENGPLGNGPSVTTVRQPTPLTAAQVVAAYPGVTPPSGVGAFRKPPEFLKEGDVVEVEIEKIGVLRNPVSTY